MRRWLSQPVNILTCLPLLFLHLHDFKVRALYRVGQNRIYTPYITVYTVISLPKTPYIHRMYMVLANPSPVPWHFCQVATCYPRAA
jgi:hypothetical protein